MVRLKSCLFVWHVWRSVIGAEEGNGGCHAWPGAVSAVCLILELAKGPIKA